ncbi:hypothetical protein ACVWWR_004764 [Bradyrhizobium sp. LM3.2]
MLLLGRKNAMEGRDHSCSRRTPRTAAAGPMAVRVRRDIGDYFGLILETVSRALSELTPKAFSASRSAPDRAAQSPAFAGHGCRTPATPPVGSVAPPSIGNNAPHAVTQPGVITNLVNPL